MSFFQNYFHAQLDTLGTYIYSFIYSRPSSLLDTGCKAGKRTGLVPGIKELTIQWGIQSSGIPRPPLFSVGICELVSLGWPQRRKSSPTELGRPLVAKSPAPAPTPQPGPVPTSRIPTPLSHRPRDLGGPRLMLSPPNTAQPSKAEVLGDKSRSLSWRDLEPGIQTLAGAAQNLRCKSC